MWVSTNGCDITVNRIGWGVLIAHGALILSLCVHHLVTRDKKQPHIVVRTVRAQKVTSSGASPAIGATETKVLKKAPMKNKPQESKKTTKASPEKIAKASVEKETSTPQPAKVETSLLKEMEEQFAELEKPKTSVARVAPLTIPSISDRLEIVSSDVPQSEGDAHYGDLLIVYLQSMLSLPELGIVKVELEVDSQGNLVRCETIEAQSKKNSDFLKKQLPELKLPCFNGKPNETFVCTILFKNL